MEDRKGIKDERGQLSIFLGISLLVIVTLLAFVINVGLFVKAKINLQNAVDAAAYSGASVQARQLSNIAYLNWEMRNTFKEWMFKYYVLGTMGLKETLNPPNPRLNFRMRPFFAAGDPSSTNQFDPYNVPSICIHFGSPHNICEIYDIPGLPRFQTVGLPSISPHHEAFLNSIAQIKANNCSVRSDINFGVAMIWAYGTGSALFQDTPEIAASRIGAWPQAIELAMRIRNLEMIVNRPAMSQSPVCMTGADGCTPVSQLDILHQGMPLDERPIKAFMSAYRNLGGGTVKKVDAGGGSFIQDNFAQTFKLYEIPPRPIDATNTLGEMLIPLEATIGNTGVLATQKQYLDLWAWPINYTTFFTTFVSDTQSNFARAGISAEAGCLGTKTALPVPGYVLGFSKNPQSLTYYAVKGEAKYVGLMFPFTEMEGITLQAYAAAKPFGGRIGPMLFGSNNAKGVKVREDTLVGRSAPYVSVFEPPPATSSSSTSSYQAGYPIPFDSNFFAKSTDSIGGIPGSGEEPRFVIPNLIFNEKNLEQQKGVGTGAIQVLQKANGQTQAYGPVSELFGLYDKSQYTDFRSNLVAPTSPTVFSEEEITRSIWSVRQPTIYEAMNYMIPMSYANGRDELHTAPNIQPLRTESDGTVQYKIFAPLFGNNTLYGTNAASVQAIIDKHIQDVKPAIEQYLDALAMVSESIMSNPARGGRDTYFNAANSIHEINPADGKKVTTYNIDPTKCDKISVATKFHFFFFGQQDSLCEIVPLSVLIRTYITDKGRQLNPDFEKYYQSTYKAPEISNEQLASAYFPGARQGVQPDGRGFNPFSRELTDSPMKRNFYSTKFVPIEKLIGTTDSYWNLTPLLQERFGSLTEGEPDTITNPSGIINNLDATLLNDFQDSLSH